jgi:hypothetical protein
MVFIIGHLTIESSMPFIIPIRMCAVMCFIISGCPLLPEDVNRGLESVRCQGIMPMPRPPFIMVPITT